MAGPFDLVLFDAGGVLVDTDQKALAEAWAAAGLDPGPVFRFLRSGYEGGDSTDHLLHRAERGELLLPDFLDLAEPSAPGIRHLLELSRPTALLRFFLPSVSWLDLAQEVEESGIGIGELTNTFDGLTIAAAMDHDPETWERADALFGHAALESHILGKRKPDPAVFIMAAEHLEVRPERILFIDDTAVNCEGATKAGLTAVHCIDGERSRAQREVRQLLELG